MNLLLIFFAAVLAPEHPDFKLPEESLLWGAERVRCGLIQEIESHDWKAITGVLVGYTHGKNNFYLWRWRDVTEASKGNWIYGISDGAVNVVIQTEDKRNVEQLGDDLGRVVQKLYLEADQRFRNQSGSDHGVILKMASLTSMASALNDLKSPEGRRYWTFIAD